ncbi:MAG: methionyl-tRNA formyltransferase [Planctomycetota bacterium]|jgi:methionyl-tRNA formyltransferase
MFSVLLLGSTDLTLEAAAVVREMGFALTGISHVGESFEISYAPGGVRNYRFADIESWCRTHGVDSIPFSSNEELAARLDGAGADFALAVGWYHMVPDTLRRRFSRGCAGVHASLLPALRGGAPLPWAILTGLDRTGVSLFALDDGIDSGPIYGQVEIPIGPQTDVGQLVEAAGRATCELLRSCLPGIADGSLVPRPQTGTPTYGLQRVPGDGVVDWAHSAAAIDRLVRAVTRPYPGARASLDGREVFIWRVEPAGPSTTIHGVPGQLFTPPGSTRPGVVTGEGFLLISEATFEDGSDAVPTLARMSQQRFDRDQGGRR